MKKWRFLRSMGGPFLAAGLAAAALSPVIAPTQASAAAISGSPANASLTTNWGTYGNVETNTFQGYNDCNDATVGTIIQAWNAERGLGTQPVPLAPLVTMFHATGGNGKQGTYDYTTADYWYTHPGLDGATIQGYYDLEPTQAGMEDLLNAYGAAYMSVDLSAAIFTRFPVVWGANVMKTNPNDAHALAAVGYDSTYIYAVTWGTVIKITWAWYLKNAFDLIEVVPNWAPAKPVVPPNAYNAQAPYSS